MSRSLNRRDFLHRAAAMIPVMHAAPLCAMPCDETPRPTNATSRFTRLRLQTAAPMTDMATFYRDVLRLKVEESRESLRVVAGETVVEFAGVTPRDGATNPYYHFAFNIPHNKLDAAIKWLEPRCPLVKKPDGSVIHYFEWWDAHAFYFLDPAGNILEFIARHTLKNDAGGDFSERDILCASEIGVVTPDVLTAVNELKRGCGIEQYKGGNDEFRAVGDEHGLFIVVKTGRKWFSSDRAAEAFETKVQLRSTPGMRQSIRLETSTLAVDGAI